MKGHKYTAQCITLRLSTFLGLESRVGNTSKARIQTPQYLSNNTPRKKRKQKVINSPNKKMKRLKTTISKLSHGKKARETKALEDALQSYLKTWLTL